jgi:DNA-binding transcriptional MerR regulator
MNTTNSEEFSALELFEPFAEAVYSIDDAARLAQTPRRLIAVYCRHGLVAPVVDPETNGWYFDDEAIRTLRRIRHLRDTAGMNLVSLRLLFSLMDEVQRLRREVRFLREL